MGHRQLGGRKRADTWGRRLVPEAGRGRKERAGEALDSPPAPLPPIPHPPGWVGGGTSGTFWPVKGQPVL